MLLYKNLYEITPEFSNWMSIGKWLRLNIIASDISQTEVESETTSVIIKTVPKS